MRWFCGSASTGRVRAEAVSCIAWRRQCGLRVLLKILQAQGSVVSKPIEVLKINFVSSSMKENVTDPLSFAAGVSLAFSGFATLFRGGLTSD